MSPGVARDLMDTDDDDDNYGATDWWIDALLMYLDKSFNSF